MRELDEFIKVLKARRVESLKNAREKNNLPLFTGEGIAYRESIDLAKEMLLNEQPTLNDNQQIVLDQICTIYSGQIYKSALQAIYIFIKRGMSEEFLKLDKKETNRVLEAFSKWVLEQEESE